MNVDAWIRELFSKVEYTRGNLHFFQDEAVDYLHANPFSALFVDLGLGKTVISLTVISDLLNTLEPVGKTLIVGPLKVILNVWPDEIAKWEHTAALKYTIIREDDDDPRIKLARKQAVDEARAELRVKGEFSPAVISKAATAVGQRAETLMRHKIRRELANSDAPIHIINREAMEWLCLHHKAQWPYRIVFIDESHSFQDHNSKRFEALKKIRNTPGLITRMHLLTATPSSESYLQFFAQIYLLDKGQRFGKYISHFRQNYFDFNSYARTYKLRKGADDVILSKISDITMVMKKEDYLPRDEPTIYARNVRLSDEQRTLYDKMERDLIISLPNGAKIEAITAAALAGKLLQMASGSVYETALIEDYDTGDRRKIRKVHDLHNHKIDMLKEIVEELQGRQLLVGYHFKSSLAKLVKAFPKATVMDKAGDAAKPWNKRKLGLMFIHPQSGGDGLNLQAGGSNLVFFDLPVSLRQYLQLIGRIDRQGQPDPVVVQLLVASGTRDEDAWRALKVKESVQDAMFKKLKALIKRYLGKQNDDEI